MEKFIPKRVYFEQGALDYNLGKKIYDEMKKLNIEIKMTGSHNRVTGIPGKTAKESFFQGKNTMVVGVRKSKEFLTCKPSAHYQLPLTTSCPGICEYCYLNTTLGKKPYLRIYVNIDEILDMAKKYIEERKPNTTVFEGAATSDPLPTEVYTGNLNETIKFFAREEYGSFRFVTKFTNVDSLLKINHNNKTRFRFSINSSDVIKRYEHNTPSIEKRLKAAKKVAAAEYPLGFIIGPIITYKDWKDDYRKMLKEIKNCLTDYPLKRVAFEFITHRYTERAKTNIMEVFPKTSLPMNKKDRKFKYGQFGYGKYVYPPEVMEEIKDFFYNNTQKLFPESEISYFV